MNIELDVRKGKIRVEISMALIALLLLPLI